MGDGPGRSTRSPPRGAPPAAHGHRRSSRRRHRPTGVRRSGDGRNHRCVRLRPVRVGSTRRSTMRDPLAAEHDHRSGLLPAHDLRTHVHPADEGWPSPRPRRLTTHDLAVAARSTMRMGTHHLERESANSASPNDFTVLRSNSSSPLQMTSLQPSRDRRGVEGWLTIVHRWGREGTTT